jgi:hypothetical protein
MARRHGITRPWVTPFQAGPAILKISIPPILMWEVAMTSATAGHTRTARGRTGEGYWMVIFASALLAIAGFFNLIDGISAIAKSSVYVANARYVMGDLHAWGWVVLILGALQLVAALGVVMGNQIARWFAVAVITVNLVAQMFFLPGYPFWSLMIIAVDVVALWGLCAYGSRENVESAI